MKTVSCTLLALLCASSALALDVNPMRDHDQLGVAITKVKLPETFAKDLTSGLTNTLLVRVVLLSNGKLIAQSASELAVKYDLWDESFRMTQRLGNSPPEAHTYKTSAEVITAFSTLGLKRLFPTNDLDRSPLTIQVELLLNPIDRERIDKIRKWVTENGNYLPSSVAGFEANNGAKSNSNVLFNKIFEQYFSGAEVAAAWKESGVTKPFRLQDIDAR